MRRISKAICVALSLTLLINLAGFEVLAEDVSSQQGEVAGAENNTNEGNVTDNNKTDALEGTDDIKNNVPDTVITDDDVNADDSDTDADVEDNKEDNKEEADVQGEDTSVDGQKEITALAAGDIKVERIAGSNNKLKISWNKVNGAASYKVELLESVNPERVVRTYNVPSGTSQEIDVTAGTKYWVKVTSVSDENKDTEVGTIPVILLAAPTAKATEGDTTVKLSWDAVTGATGYQVIYDGKANAVTGTTYDAKKLKNGTKYSFEVKAVYEVTYENKKYIYESEPSTIQATPKSQVPAQVTGLTGIDGEKSAILTWSKAARAESYVVYRYNESKKTWEVVKKNITKLTYTDTKLTAGKTYKYRVAAVNDGGTGSVSSTISISVKKTPGTKVRTIGYKAVVKSRAPLFTSKGSKKRVKYLSKGTRVTTIDYGSGRYQIKLSNGKTYWISKDRLTFKASIWTTKDYSTKVKEDFVNKKGYKSSSKYLIWISAYTQRVIIFEGKKGQWKMIRNCRCATGTHLHPTPKGTFKITYKEKGWFYKTTYEKPIVHFKSQNSFHSRIKNYKGGYADATIGKPRSKGCVRLYDEDINFIYKKCPKGTTVVSH